MTAEELVRRVMSRHWDIKACDCPVCQYGRTQGWGAVSPYLHDRGIQEIEKLCDRLGPLMDGELQYRNGAWHRVTS